MKVTQRANAHVRMRLTGQHVTATYVRTVRRGLKTRWQLAVPVASFRECASHLGMVPSLVPFSNSAILNLVATNLNRLPERVVDALLRLLHVYARCGCHNGLCVYVSYFAERYSKTLDWLKAVLVRLSHNERLARSRQKASLIVRLLRWIKVFIISVL